MRKHPEPVRPDTREVVSDPDELIECLQQYYEALCRWARVDEQHLQGCRRAASKGIECARQLERQHEASAVRHRTQAVGIQATIQLLEEAGGLR